MPVRAAKRGKSWKVVEASTGRVTPSSGTFKTQGEAQRQARAINSSLKRKGKI